MIFNGTVGAGADNGYIDDNGSAFVTDSTLVFGNFAGTDTYSMWARWTNVTIPQSAVINSVTITLQGFNTSNDTCNANIYFDNEDNATAPTTYSDYIGRAVTSGIAWNSIPHFSAGVDVTLPDLTTILQTIINRSGWVSGNALQLFIRDNASSSNAYRQAVEHSVDAVNCPRISINYTIVVPQTVLFVGNRASQPINKTNIIMF